MYAPKDEAIVYHTQAMRGLVPWRCRTDRHLLPDDEAKVVPRIECFLGVPPVRVGPGHPAGLPRRIPPVTGSESDPKHGYPGTRLATCPRGQRACQSPPEIIQTRSKRSSAILAQYLPATTHAVTKAIHDHAYLGYPSTRVVA